MEEPEVEEEDEEGEGPRSFSVGDTPTGQTGFAALIIDASAPPEQESLLYHYQNHAMQWDVSRIKGQLEALFGIGSDALSQVCLRILPVVCESFAHGSSS